MSAEILFLSHRVPFPPNRGDKIRSWNVLKALCRLAPVHVVAIADDPDDLQYADDIRAIAASVQLVPHRVSRIAAAALSLVSGLPASVQACSSPAMAEAVARVLRDEPISAIYAFSGQMAQYVPTELAGKRFVMDFVDMDSAKFEQFAREASGAAKVANSVEARRLFNFERATADRADVSLLVSEAEASLFRDKCQLEHASIVALDNGIDLEHFHPDHASLALVAGSGPLAVFTGQMDYQPNVDAVDWFARDVVARVEGLRFAIVGRSPTAQVQRLAQRPGVIVTGAVPDTRDWLAAASVVVAPLTLARGIQNKVLEAMAMGKPVVATPAAAEGIDAVDGVDLIIADGANATASAISALLADPSRANALGASARRRMESRYSWTSRLAGLGQLVGIPPLAALP